MSGDGAAPDAIPAVEARSWRKPRDPQPEPRTRQLKIFAIDPSAATDFETAALSITAIDVQYEPQLRRGPAGEYIEVVDIDPASNRFYQPVDLQNRALAVAGGLDPSEGSPQFHQQMVYAVAMRTIKAFEDALGRKALWRPWREGKTGDYRYVPRLRLYPHAMRARNAYYSPVKVAVLFGYFNAATADRASVKDGTIVFSCLSADIIAHEVTHALLDGQHRRFEESSNDDVPAFHEGFADIVALFQHFTNRPLLEWSMARSRASIGDAAPRFDKDGKPLTASDDAQGFGARSLLSGLAQQFGRASGKEGALRDYGGGDIAGLRYPDVTDAHARGSILVRAVYSAFLTIIDRRNRDLIQLATGGSGLLPAGELHPKLVERLARETAKAAVQVQRMCIRALDFCPPADITFGEYLRALMTADIGHVAEDSFGYRTAFIQAFRAANLLPSTLRTVSVESLVWRKTEIGGIDLWLKKLVDALDIHWGEERSRPTIFAAAEGRRATVWGLFDAAFARTAEFAADADAAEAGGNMDRAEHLRDRAAAMLKPAMFGLESGLAKFGDDFLPVKGGAADTGNRTHFEVHNVRRIKRSRPDGRVVQLIVIVLAQRRAEPLVEKDPSQGWFWFRGGATLIVDPYPDRPDRHDKPELRYVITKSMNDANRLKAQREHLARPANDLRRQYFKAMAEREPFAMLHSMPPKGATPVDYGDSGSKEAVQWPA